MGKRSNYQKYVGKRLGSKNATLLKHVQTLEWENVDLDTPEGQSRFVELNKSAVEGGYEGVMIKILMGGMNAKEHIIG